MACLLLCGSGFLGFQGVDQVRLQRDALWPERAVLVAFANLLRREPESVHQDLHVVLSAQRPCPLHARGRLREEERRVLRQMLPDHRVVDRGVHALLPKLRVVLHAVLVALDRRSGNARRLAHGGQLVLIQRERPLLDVAVQLFLVPDAAGRGGEAVFVRPRRRAHQLHQRAPFALVEACDYAPVVVAVALRAVGVVRRSRRAPVGVEHGALRPHGAVAGREVLAAAVSPVDGLVQDRRAGQCDAGSHLRHVHPLPFPGRVAVVQGGQDAHHRVHPAGVVHVRPAPARGRRVRQPGREGEAAQRLHDWAHGVVVLVAPGLAQPGHGT